MRRNVKKYNILWKKVLYDMRLNIIAFVILLILMILSMQWIRTALLKNAQETGAALTRNYAAEETGNLAVYETLLSFGTVSIDRRMEDGSTKEELEEWLEIYFERINAVLGEGVVDPYAVIDGKILAANPWENDDVYDFYQTEWYQKAIDSPGETVFTDVYEDAIYQKPVVTVAEKCAKENAVIAFDIFPENFRFQFNPLDLKAGDSFFLCDGNGTIIYKETDMEQDDEEIQEYLIGLLAEIHGGEHESFDDYFIDADGRKRTVYYDEMENGWFSIVTVPYSNILGKLHWIALGIGAVTGVYLITFLWMFRRDLKVKRRMERTNETVRVLGNSYYALYRVNFEENTYEMIKGSDYVRSRLPKMGNYEELVGVMMEIIEPDACEEFMSSFSRDSIRKLVSQRVRDFGGDFLRRFGEEYHWVSVRVLFDESLSPTEVVLCFRKVEEEKQRQLQERKLLENSLETAQQNEQAKQTFFSNMSHDMRTPLNAIIGLSELAGQQSEDPEKVREYLEKINTSSKQLLGLINDILDMSRMEQGHVMLNNKQFNIRECVEESLQAFSFQAENENKELHVEMNMSRTELFGDPFRIGQILNNLLSNAMKFTREGGTVTLKVEQIGSGDFLKYKFVVADTGIGMSKEFLEQIFEPYAREMRFSAKQATGTGLGMSITKSLVVQMNGEIYVESELGVGSRFTVILPFAAAKNTTECTSVEGETLQAEPEKSLEGCHILLAEDNEVNMEIATEILAMNGIEVSQAWNGAEAVKLFEQSASGTFDAILMDMQMPEMDGCEAARRIRASQKPDGKTVPIIAVTANAFAEDIAATTDAGMDAHVSKPIDFTLLCQTLSKFIQKN